MQSSEKVDLGGYDLTFRFPNLQSQSSPNFFSPYVRRTAVDQVFVQFGIFTSVPEIFAVKFCSRLK